MSEQTTTEASLEYALKPTANVKTVHVDYLAKDKNEIEEVEMIAFAELKTRLEAVRAAKRSIGQRFGSVMFYSQGKDKGYFRKGVKVLGWYEFNRK